MGGKSVYLKQVALLQIMAQIGCFVPAEEAELRITDKIFTRMGFDDSIELKASTFQLEMREMRYILKNVTNKSLVLVDELCQSTASEEGTALALVLCKQLLEYQAYTFLATHFLALTKLQSWHSNVANHHMGASSNAEGRLIYTHRISLGVTSITKYGLTLANIAGFPKDLLDRANEIYAKLEGEMLPFQKHDDVKTEEELVNEVYQELAELIEANKWSVEEVAKVQKKWRPILAPFTLSSETPENQEDVAGETDNHDGIVGEAENQEDIAEEAKNKADIVGEADNQEDIAGVSDNQEDLAEEANNQVDIAGEADNQENIAGESDNREDIAGESNSQFVAEDEEYQEDFAREPDNENAQSVLTSIASENASNTHCQGDINVECLHPELLYKKSNQSSAATSTVSKILCTASKNMITPPNHLNIQNECFTPQQVNHNNLFMQTHCETVEQTPPNSKIHDSTSSEINPYKVVEIMSLKNQEVRVPDNVVFPATVRSSGQLGFSPMTHNHKAEAVNDYKEPQPNIKRRTFGEFTLREFGGENAEHIYGNVSSTSKQTGSKLNFQDKQRRLLSENCLDVHHYPLSADNCKKVRSCHRPERFYNSANELDTMPKRLSGDAINKFSFISGPQIQKFTQKSTTEIPRDRTTSLDHRAHNLTSTPIRYQGQNDHLEYELATDPQAALRSNLPYTPILSADKKYPFTVSQSKQGKSNDIISTKNSPVIQQHSVFEPYISKCTPKNSHELFDFSQDVSPIRKISPKFRMPSLNQRLDGDNKTYYGMQTPCTPLVTSVEEDNMSSCSNSIRLTEGKRNSFKYAPARSPAQAQKCFQPPFTPPSAGNRTNSSIFHQTSSPMTLNLTPNLSKLPRYSIDLMELEEEQMSSLEEGEY